MLRLWEYRLNAAVCIQTPVHDNQQPDEYPNQGGVERIDDDAPASGAVALVAVFHGMAVPVPGAPIALLRMNVV